MTRITLADDPDDPVDYKRAASNAVRHSEKSSRSVYIEAEKPQEEPKHLIYCQERSDKGDSDVAKGVSPRG